MKNALFLALWRPIAPARLQPRPAREEQREAPALEVSVLPWGSRAIGRRREQAGESVALGTQPGPESVQVVSHVPWSPTPELFQAQGSQDCLSPLLVW